MLIYNIIAKIAKCWVTKDTLDDTWNIADVAHIADSRGQATKVPHELEIQLLIDPRSTFDKFLSEWDSWRHFSLNMLLTSFWLARQSTITSCNTFDCACAHY